MSRFSKRKEHENYLSAKWRSHVKDGDGETGKIRKMRSTHVSDLRSCHTAARQQLVGEKAGGAKFEDITWTVKTSSGAKATPENTWISPPNIATATSPPWAEKLALPIVLGSVGRSLFLCCCWLLGWPVDGKSLFMVLFTTAVHVVIMAGGLPALSSSACITTGFWALSHLCIFHPITKGPASGSLGDM